MTQGTSSRSRSGGALSGWPSKKPARRVRGFELAEQELIEHASHGDDHTPARIIRDAGPQEEPASSVYGEADEESLPDQ